MTDRIIGRRRFQFGTIGSTMEAAARLGDAGEPEGAVVTASEQTAGRGRAGRVWLAPPHGALLCSILLRPDVPPERLPVFALLVGVATADAIEAITGLRCQLKWPNDLWLGQANEGRKVAGILVTSRVTYRQIDYAIAGIGINVNARLEELPPGATSLRAEAGATVEQGALFACLVDRLNDAYAVYLATGGRPNLEAWRQRAAMLGERVAIVDGDAEQVGVFVGIDDDGALLLRADSGQVQRVIAGDLTRGPRSLGLG